MPRVVITGAGTINALGHDVPTTLSALAAGHGGIGPLDIPDVDRLTNRIAGQVRGWTASAHFDLRSLSLYDRMTQFALWSARQAVAQSGLVFDDRLALRSGVILGTAGGGLGTTDDSYRAVYAEGKNRVHPLTVPRLMANAGVSHISMTYGLRGPAFTVSTACASSNHAMGLAFQMVRSGAAPVMLTGGAEAMLTFGGLKAWEGLRVMSAETCRPFCATRSGMVQGEGAAVFVFEDFDHAQSRGADILAEVAGFAMTSDAHDIVMPSLDGAVRAMQGALDDAGLPASAVNYINAHGTATRANDANEVAAIRTVFGAGVPLVSSTKSAHGHLIGAAGAVELLPCLMALQQGVIAPTLNYQSADPDCAIDVVPNTARQAQVDVALSNAFAFGGLNAVLALRRFRGL
jgi:nodulation protein E